MVTIRHGPGPTSQSPRRFHEPQHKSRKLDINRGESL